MDGRGVAENFVSGQITWSIEVIETVDVLHDFLLSRTNGSEDKKILEVAVVREVASLQHDALEQLNKLSREIALHERFDSC